MTNRVGGFIAACLLLGLSSPSAAAETPVWPPPPETARYAYLGALHGERDVAEKPGFFGRLAALVLGERAERVLVRPHGVAVAADGTLAVADPGLPGVHLFHRERREYRLIAAAGDDPWVSPVGVAFTPQDTLVVADSGAPAVLELTRRGKRLRRFETGQLARPAGIAVDPRDGRVFVADSAAHRVVVFDAQGAKRSEFGRRGGAPGEFNFPTHVALTGEGRLLVTDSLNFRVQEFDDSGAPRRQFGRLGDRLGDFSKPKGVAVGGDGRIYIVEAYFDHLLVFDPDDRLLLPIGGNGAAPGQFNLPAGVAAHGDRVYVADSYNRRVQIFRALTPAE